MIGRMAGTGKQPQSGDTTTVKQVGRDFGPSQRFTMDWSNIDGSMENIVLGESGNPLSPYSATNGKTGMAERPSRFHSPHPPWPPRPGTRCGCCVKPAALVYHDSNDC